MPRLAEGPGADLPRRARRARRRSSAIPAACGRSSSIWSATPSSSPSAARCSSTSALKTATGPPGDAALHRPATRASASRPTSSSRSSSPSARPTARPRGASAAPAWDWPSPRSWSSLMGGRIWVESEVGQRQHVPLHGPPSICRRQPRADDPADRPVAARRPCRVLVVVSANADSPPHLLRNAGRLRRAGPSRSAARRRPSDAVGPRAPPGPAVRAGRDRRRRRRRRGFALAEAAVATTIRRRAPTARSSCSPGRPDSTASNAAGSSASRTA